MRSRRCEGILEKFHLNLAQFRPKGLGRLSARESHRRQHGKSPYGFDNLQAVY